MRQLLISILALLYPLAGLAGEQPVQLVTAVDSHQSASSAYRQFIAELFGRIPAAYTLSYRPARRAEMELANRQFDGDAGRGADFGSKYPELIRVDPSYFELRFFAISYARSVTAWRDLYGLNIAYLRGIVAVESQLGAHAKLYPSDSVTACIRMVKAHRVEACILNSAAPANQEFTDATPALSNTEFGHSPVYFWLTPQHQVLAQQISTVLRQMQKDGSLARYQRRFEPPSN
ncbi:transporter substrate-binding domain-containing protein [Chitinibacter fontanus]|uniref:Transporter substrate-binding domain-containing protein n=1 Tax=Chitinibacter fontanus TaxID=1737446 RepID=A0A7D5ZFR3_9NEIS|nr:transporter substrate-binding domain-containing protein [Chitinibacter fontanus]QLI81049.1 transporter substrate-binding domain-containing protein [Chitinibacter fontanus]